MRAFGLALLLMSLPGPVARAGDGDVAFREWLRPRATLRTAAWTSSRTVDDRSPLLGTAAWAELAPRVGSRLELRLSGWVGAGSLVQPGEVEGSVRELYAGARLGPVDVRVGKQIMAWGRTDALNPTDNLTPRDFTLPVAEDDDQKIGVPSAQVSLHLGRTALTGIWLAGFHGHTTPRASAPPGLRLAFPEPEGTARQGALRLEHSGGTVDWSVSWFSGLDLSPDPALREEGGAPTLVFEHHRLHVIGADAATVLGRYGVRGEAAWITTEDRDGRDPGIKNSTLYAIVGADRTFGGYFNVNVQYLFRRVRGFSSPWAVPDPGQREVNVLVAASSQQLRPVQHGITVRVANAWWHETLRAEVSGLVLWTPRQFLIRPRAYYAVTDRWQVVLGADAPGGQSGTLYRSLRKNATAFVEVRLGL